MRRRDFLRGGGALGLCLLSPSAAVQAADNSPMTFSGQPASIRLAAYVAEYLSRYYQRCDGLFLDLPELADGLSMPQIDPSNEGARSLETRVAERRLSPALASESYMRFERHVQDFAEVDFADENVVVLDGWILPLIDAEVLAFRG